jgi:hypothetical protein
MSSPEVSITAVGSKGEKGRALEQAVGAVWSELGYRKLVFNARVTGEEIDVEGTHVVSGEILKGQCKAHAEQIDAPPLRLFFGDVEKARGKSPRLAGVFVSLSGLSGTAQKWYDELSSGQREYFKLQNDVEFIAHLREAQLILSADALVRRLGELTKLQVSGLRLLLSERGPFWNVAFSDPGKSNAYYCLLTGLGEKPRQEDIEHLEARLSTTATLAKRITLKGRESTISALLRNERRTVQQIAEDTLESHEDISAAASSLAVEGLIKINGTDLTLRAEIESFLAIAKISIDSPIELTFMKSRFFAKGTNQLLIPFIQSKYRVAFSAEEVSMISKLLSLSPRCVRWAITGDAETYRNTDDHIRELELKNPKVGEYRTHLKQSVFQKLLQNFLWDHDDQKTSPLFELHGIHLTRTEVGIKLATRDQFFFQLQSNWYTGMMRAKGPVKAGQILGAQGPDSLLELADGRLLMEEFRDAITSYEDVIRHWPDSEAAKYALHNKGVCLMRKEFWEAAIGIFKSLSDFESGQKTILGNLAQCHARLGQKQEAENCFTKLHQKFGNDGYVTKLRTDIDSILTATAATPNPSAVSSK